jgi:prepilin-type N-terminal cleavage/methylation domain-containing protein
MKMRTPKNDIRVSRESGFTLVEVMMAIAIFSIGILAVWALQHISTKNNTTARNLTIATVCSSDQLERLMKLPSTHANLTAGTHTPSQTTDVIDNNFNGSVDEPGESGLLRVSWVVTDNTPIIRSKEITVTVTWNNQLHQRSLSMTSYKAEL